MSIDEAALARQPAQARHLPGGQRQRRLGPRAGRSTPASTCSASTAPASSSPTSRTCCATSRPATGPAASSSRPRPTPARAPAPRRSSRRRCVTSRDVTAEAERWPVLASAMADQPVRAVLGTPGADRRRAGRHARRLPRARPRLGRQRGRRARQLRRGHRHDPDAPRVQAHTAGELARQLQYALDYRVVIERAVGYLMAKESIDAGRRLQRAAHRRPQPAYEDRRGRRARPRARRPAGLSPVRRAWVDARGVRLRHAGEHRMSTTSRPISATPEQVWAVLADGWLYPLFVVGASRMREVDDGWPAVGTRLHHSVGTWPLLIDDTTEVLEVEEDRRILLLARGWPAGQAHVEITLEPRGTDTVVTIVEQATAGPGALDPQAAAGRRSCTCATSRPCAGWPSWWRAAPGDARGAPPYDAIVDRRRSQRTGRRQPAGRRRLGRAGARGAARRRAAPCAATARCTPTSSTTPSARSTRWPSPRAR